MKILIQISLISFLIFSAIGVWKMGKPLARRLKVKESFWGMLAYFGIHFIIIILVVVLFKFLMLWLVKQYVEGGGT